jgi:hypothetical protein
MELYGNYNKCFKLYFIAYKVKFNSDGRKDLSENGKSPDSTFNNFLEGFVSVFIVLANDGWSKIFIDCFRAGN